MASKISATWRSFLGIFGRKDSKQPPQTANELAAQPLVLLPSLISSKPPESFPDSSRGIVEWRTLVSAPDTQSCSLVAGIATCPAKADTLGAVGGHLCAHRHKQPELYHIVAGRGLMEIDGREFEVEKGTVVYIPGDAEHGIKNIGGANEDLVWLYVFPGDSFGEVVYRFKGDTPAGSG